MKKIIGIIVALIFFHTHLSAQNNIDSLKNHIYSVPDTMLATKYLEIAENETVFDSVLKYSQLAISQDSSFESKQNVGYVILYKGWRNYSKSLYSEANKYFFKANEYFDLINDSLSIGYAYYGLGMNNKYWGRYKNALEYIHKSIKIFEEKGTEEDIIGSMIVESYIQDAWGHYIESYKICQQTYIMAKKNGNMDQMSYSALAIGNYFLSQQQLDSADFYFEIALENFIRLKSAYGRALVYRDKGKMYHGSKNYARANNMYLQSLSLLEKNQNKRGISELLILLGELNYETGNLKESKKYLEKGQALAIEIELIEDVINNYLTLSQIEEKTGNYSLSLKYYKDYVSLRDTVFNREKHEQIADLSAKYETEKKQQQIELQNIQLEKKQSTIKLQQIISAILSVLVLLTLFLAYTIFRFYRTKKRDNEILTKQKNEIEYKNRQITDSIIYAQKIQQSILPSENKLNTILQEYFIFFKPRDIVSGDFYYATEINDWLIITAVDCTGHGVPGAFMSMLGNAFLNDIMSACSFQKASDILETLRIKVKEALQTSENEDNSKDGMDMSLIMMNKKTMKLQFSGAYNPMILIRNTELIEIKGTKSPIGVHYRELPFENHEMDLFTNDSIYLFSDGYADQMGGEKDSKFTIRNLRSLLVEVNKFNMLEQKAILEKTLNNWMKTSKKQIDDILVLGIKI